MNHKDQLINNLINESYLKSPEIIKAFQKVDRADFVPAELQESAYQNYPLPIGLGQTISQPATVALMLELLQAKLGDKILDVGCGSGWQTALLAELVGKKGQVIGLEIKSDLIKRAKNNLAKYHYNNITLVEGNGWQGLPESAPFDKIIVAAAALKIPDNLIKQLANGGRLVMPVGQDLQDIVVINKLSDKDLTEKHYPGFIFVPLISE